MNPTNPKTGQPQYVISKDELAELPGHALRSRRLEQDRYYECDDLSRELMATFEFAAAELMQSDWGTSPQIAKHNWTTTKNAVEAIKSEIGKFRLEMWISEVIQNAIDAQWGSDEVLAIEVDIQETKDGFSIHFRHNGRPPQHLDYAQNELFMMLSLGGNKAADFSTIGEFGIGFKIWTLIFDEVTLRHGWTSVLCRQDEKIEVENVERPDHDWFEIIATLRKDPGRSLTEDEKLDRSILASFFEDPVDQSTKQNTLEGLFRRTIHGFRQRDVACSIEIQKNGEEWLKFRKEPTEVTEELTSCLTGYSLVARRWDIVENYHGGAVNRFSMTSFQLPFSDEVKDQLQGSISRLLMSDNVITDRLRSIFEQQKQSGSNPDQGWDQFVLGQATEAAKNVYVGLNLVEVGLPDAALHYSLFELGDVKARPERFFMFQGRFKTNRERTQLVKSRKEERVVAKREAATKYNTLLFDHSMNLFLHVLELMTNHRDQLTELGLSNEAYMHMLSSFGEGDAEVDWWLEQLKDQLNKHLGPDGVMAWPSLDGALVYADLKEPREGMLELLNHEDREIAEWAKSALDPRESVLRLGEAADAEWREFLWKLPDAIGYLPYVETDEEFEEFPEGWEAIEVASTYVPPPPESLIAYLAETSKEEE